MMKKFCLLPIAAAFVIAVSCEKPMSEADRNAQVEREVQQRLAAERQADEQQRLAQQQAELDAREQALAAKEAAGTTDTTIAVATPRPTARAIATASSGTRVASSDQSAPRGYDTFYRKLQPHGAWRETADYGYVWQPKQAQQSRDWRPYTDGRWAYTDAGWTWVSEEPFGWATYHYGRWTRLRDVGWVWVPGEEWAPAWVSWRSSNEHVGWAPLPPEAKFEHRTGIKKWADSYYDIDADEYVFIPNEEIGSSNIERSVIPVERNYTIVNETTNVTNLTYSNTTIINEGPNYDELRGRSREPLRRMRIEREYDLDEREAPRASVTGEVIAMITPMFTARAVQRPQTVGAPIQQGSVERGWNGRGGNQAEAERTRAKMRAEATPPPDAPPKRFEKPIVAEGTPAPAPATASATAPASIAPQSTATPYSRATPSPAATVAPVTATPFASASATAAFTPRPPATLTPSASAIPTATPTPRMTATPLPSATATVAASATATATPRPIATPTPTPLPVTTPVPPPVPTATVRATATPPPTAPPVSTASPAASVATSPVVPPTRRTAPPRATASPVMAPPVATAAPGEDAGDPPITSPGLTGQDARGQRGTDRAEQLRKRDEAKNNRIQKMADAVTPAPTAAVAMTPPIAAATAPAFTPRQAAPVRVATPAPAATSNDTLRELHEATPVPRKNLPVATPAPAAVAIPTAAARMTPPRPIATPTPAEAAAEPAPTTRRATSRLSDLEAAASPGVSPTPTPSPVADARGKRPKRGGAPGQPVDEAAAPEASPAGANTP